MKRETWHNIGFFTYVGVSMVAICVDMPFLWKVGVLLLSPVGVFVGIFWIKVIKGLLKVE